MFASGQILDGIYQVGEKIGQGGTGVVYSGWHLRLNKQIVINRLHGTHNARAEADVLKNLHHPGLPQMYDFIQVGQDVYTIMDWIPGSSLDHFLEQGRRIDTRAAIRWLRQLLDVLEYLHSRKPMILHNDIKPGNIMLRPNGELCLIDFNISMYADSGAITGYTAGYASPEQVRLAWQILYRQPTTVELDARSDLYALGATMYALICGSPPAETGPVQPLQAMNHLTVAPGLCAIIDRAMCPRRELRYSSARRMKAALDNYTRYAGHYRTYLAAQALCWGVGILLVAAGVYFLVGSIPQRQVERFQSSYNQYCRVLESGNTRDASALAVEILGDNTYTEILEENPKILCAMLHETGSAYYDLEEYGLALQYYQQAVAALTPEVQGRSAYYCDAAMAAVEDGQPEAAEQLLTQARQAGVDADSLLLTQAAVYAARQERDACYEAVETLLESAQSDPAGKELCARACLLAADVSESASQRLEWLQKARACEESRIVLRRLGAAAYAVYRERPDSGRRYLELSAECYATLCAGGYPTRQDRVNLAAVQMTQGRYNDCRETLRALEEEYPDDFEILTELAVVNTLQGESEASARYLKRAEEAWQALSEEQRRNLPEELREQFDQLRESED